MAAGIFPADLKQVHDFFVGRGWRLIYNDLDEEGVPRNPEALWGYAPGYGGATINSLDGVEPSKPDAALNLESDKPELEITTAGNENGCPQHARHVVISLELTAGTTELDSLNPVLDEIESAARAMNPRELIECRFFGACGASRG
ncbi:MAG TPA: hypothetical protein VNO31_37355 [Umezawaea sp.]|nr:hypothetical protein [Umezawaea sp.]